MSDFLNWELTNRMHNLGYDGKTLMYIDDEEDIINDDSAELIGAKPAILTSAAFRWFRDKYNLHHSISTLQGSCTYHFKIRTIEYESDLKPFGDSKIIFEDGPRKKYGDIELDCLVKLIEIVKENK